MKQLYFSTLLIVILSFFLAIVLNIIPLTPTLAIIYPLWLPLILIYWVMVLPEHIHLTLAWILGLIIDVLHGSYLGEHSLALCVITFLAYRFHLQFRMFPSTQQVIFIFILLLIYQGLLVWMQSFLGFSIALRWIWISLIVSALLWPILQKLLKINLIDMQQ
ncbi:MAG: rod shape-determining protein MreD [Rickettsiella sp.]|nr:rod shape-determining protein MreD [Rickettsiella sp.]